MGILRISPNTMYGRDADDPTLLLNTLVDFDNVFFETDNKNKHIEVQLSDSDGNLLPIRFVPKVFRTEKVFTGTEYLPKNLINICTFVNRNIHVSNKMSSRSTIELVNPHEKKSQLLIASGVDNTLNADEILFYPLEAPNDDDFFNNKNKLFLFNSNDSTPRHEQM
jgi:hypothetical protein